MKLCTFYKSYVYIFFHTFIMCSRSGLTITLHILHNMSVVNTVTLFSKRSMQVCKKLSAPTGFVTPCLINFSMTMKNLQVMLFLIRIPSVEIWTNVYHVQFLINMSTDIRNSHLSSLASLRSLSWNIRSMSVKAGHPCITALLVRVPAL